VVGPHTGNFRDEVEALLAAGAAVRVADATALATAVIADLSDARLRQEAGRRGAAVVAAHRGAAVRVLALLERHWKD
jgi:3-deoxy-D-manno-octulosonic-acid transferase